MTCDGNVYLNEKFKASGAVLLRNARIKTELNCSNGVFAALLAGGMTCDGKVYLNENFKASDEVELTDATVGRELNCKDGKFEKLDAPRLRVGAKFDWQPNKTPECVDVSFAEVSLLHDNPNSWPSGEKGPRKNRTELVGFTFGDLGEEVYGSGTEKKAVQTRIDWLKNVSYAPGVYRQLTRIYRQKGRSRAATKIAIAGQRDRRRRGGMPWGSRIWSLFLDVSVGYGYRIYRTLFAVLGGWFLGWLFFSLAQANHLMEAVGGTPGVAAAANKCTSNYPCFFPPAYGLEIFLPVINLRQVSFWLPSAATLPGKLLLGWVWLAIVLGWVVTVAVAAGIGTLFSQRD